MQQLHHKRNKKKEVEFFQNEECTIPFDFKNAKDLYIDGLNGDITPLFVLDDKFENCNVYVPYLPNAEQIEIYSLLIILNSVLHARGIKLYTLSSIGGVANRNAVIDNTAIFTIIPNLSKYIPEDNAVLFLMQEDTLKYYEIFKDHTCAMLNKVTLDIIKEKNIKKLTIFIHHGIQSELQKANEVAKELKEKYGVEELNLFVLHYFQKLKDRYRSDEVKLFDIHDAMYAEEYFSNINKIITTNSTGILPVQDKERLQVIDCKEMFEGGFKRK